MIAAKEPLHRVDRGHKCPVCNHETWCLYNTQIVICMRVQSPKQKTFKGGEVGWIHDISGVTNVTTPPPKKAPPSINVKRLMEEWTQFRRSYSTIAKVLNVSMESLALLECVKAPWHRAWGFPMKDGYGNYIGIRIRSEDGQKWAQPGSHAGIFIPTIKPQRRMLVVEGPTDTAAALTMGYYAIGRPSCSGGTTHVVDFVRRNHIPEVVIVCDNDGPGIMGARDLQRWLPVPSCLVVLPTKDLREFLRIGDKFTIDSMIEQLVWTQPRKAA